MRKWLTALTLTVSILACIQITAKAQQNETNEGTDSAKTSLVKELLELTGSRQNTEVMLRAMVVKFKQEFPDMPDEYLDELKQELNYDSMVIKIVPIYTRHWSVSDIKGLIAFYKTPLGQKMIQETPKIMQECMELNIQQTRVITQKMLERLEQQGAPDETEEEPPVMMEVQ